MFQRSNPPPPEPKTNKPQFPDLLFTDRGVECEGEAEHRDDAIRASFIWFKHQWPGVTAEIVDATDGVYATMVAIAA